MRHRTLDEMIAYFNRQVSDMDIKREYKIQLLGMITAIGYEASAQPERKKGKWIPVTQIYKVTEGQFPKMHIEWVDATEPDEIDGVRCSERGTVYDFTEARNWCSECGARMER